MKVIIKSVIWNIRKQKTVNQNNKDIYFLNDYSASSLWDNFKHSDIHIVEVPEEEEKEQEIGNLFLKKYERKLDEGNRHESSRNKESPR